jgi:hypothetical protein
VGKCINKKYWGLLYIEHCGKIYLHKILRNIVCGALGRFIYTKDWGLLYVEHCGINLPTMLNIKYSSVFCVNKYSHSAQHKVSLSILCK